MNITQERIKGAIFELGLIIKNIEYREKITIECPTIDEATILEDLERLKDLNIGLWKIHDEIEEETK